MTGERERGREIETEGERETRRRSPGKRRAALREARAQRRRLQHEPMFVRKRRAYYHDQDLEGLDYCLGYCPIA